MTRNFENNVEDTRDKFSDAEIQHMKNKINKIYEYNPDESFTHSPFKMLSEHEIENIVEK